MRQSISYLDTLALARHEANREQADRDLDAFADKVMEYAKVNVELLVQKHRDYGPKNISGAPGGALNGIRVRMHDKLARINHLLDTGADPTNESLQDSFIDLANYAVIALMVMDGEWDK